MGKYQKFDELPVWQEGAKLYQRVLDLLEEGNSPLSPTFRNQLERATLAVASHVAQSFDRMSQNESLGHLYDARAGAAEVQSMCAAVAQRPKLARLKEALLQIRMMAETCGRQLSAWITAVEHGPSRSKQSAPRNDDTARPPASAEAEFTQ